MTAAPVAPPQVNGHREGGLTGHLTTLRAIHEGDLPTLYHWRTDLSSIHLWSAAKRPMTFEEFQQEFRAMATGNMLMLFESKESREPVGFAQVAQIDPQHGHASLLFFISGDYQKRGRYPMDAFLLLERYLFEYFALRKLYADVPEYNRDSWHSLLRFGWQEEGPYREHVWFKDRYWDLRRLSTSRAQWQATAERYEIRLKRTATRRGGEQ